jgi:hypothetical protein
MFRCSKSKNGSSKIETVKYLQEFLVKGSDLRSARSQQGTKAENKTVTKSNTHAVTELI